MKVNCDLHGSDATPGGLPNGFAMGDVAASPATADPRTTPVPRQPAVVGQPSTCPPQLARECRIYTRYLLGQPATAYVLEKYADFHRQHGLVDGRSNDPFDRLLVAVSRRAVWLVGWADAYASRWARRATVRRKLVALLAILECSPTTFTAIDDVGATGPVRGLLYLALRGMTYVLTLLAATVLLGPLHVALRCCRPAGGGRPA